MKTKTRERESGKKSIENAAEIKWNWTKCVTSYTRALRRITLRRARVTQSTHRSQHGLTHSDGPMLTLCRDDAPRTLPLHLPFNNLILERSNVMRTKHPPYLIWIFPRSISSPFLLWLNLTDTLVSAGFHLFGEPWLDCFFTCFGIRSPMCRCRWWIRFSILFTRRPRSPSVPLSFVNERT